jgi:phage terminase Nu1 subunit (DNA packaging protein)
MALGRIVSQHELSDIMGVSQKSLSLWQKDEGLPVELETENGVANQYNTAKVIAWYVARERARGERESEKDRLARLQGDMLEIELAEKRGGLIPAADIEPAWTGMVVATRQALLTLPARLAPLLAQMDGPDPMRDLLEEQIEETLLKLTTHGQPSADSTADAGVRPVGAAVEDPAVALG